MLLPEDDGETTAETKRFCYAFAQNPNGCIVKKEKNEETGLKTTTTLCFCSDPYCNAAGLKMPSFWVILVTVLLVNAVME